MESMMERAGCTASIGNEVGVMLTAGCAGGEADGALVAASVAEAAGALLGDAVGLGV
jgi:hypothetical protein